MDLDLDVEAVPQAAPERLLHRLGPLEEQPQAAGGQPLGGDGERGAGQFRHLLLDGRLHVVGKPPPPGQHEFVLGPAQDLEPGRR